MICCSLSLHLTFRKPSQTKLALLAPPISSQSISHAYLQFISSWLRCHTWIAAASAHQATFAGPSHSKSLFPVAQVGSRSNACFGFNVVCLISCVSDSSKTVMLHALLCRRPCETRLIQNHCFQSRQRALKPRLLMKHLCHMSCSEHICRRLGWGV